MQKMSQKIWVHLWVCCFFLVLAGCKSTSTRPSGYDSTGMKAAAVPSRPVLRPTPALMTSKLSGWVAYSAAVSHDPLVTQIFVKNLGSGEITQLTNSGNNQGPRWSPDGSQILYISSIEGNLHDVYLIDKEGSRSVPLVAGPSDEIMADWSPDGSKVVFVSDQSGRDEIYVLNVHTHDLVQLTNVATGAYVPKWSPNGERIAFASVSNIEKAPGRPQIFIMNTDGTDIRQVTESDVDHVDDTPIWCPQSDCIIFSRNTSKLMLLNLLEFRVLTAELGP